MKVTKAKLATKLGIDKKRVQQFGQRQLFIVTGSSGNFEALYSYYTKVGVRVHLTIAGGTAWVITTSYCSRTTSNQLKWFSQHNTIIGYGAI